MIQRLLVAAIGIPAVFVALFWPGGKAFAVAGALIAVVAVLELASAVSEDGSPSLIWPLTGAGILIGTSLCPATAVFRIPALTLWFLAAFAFEALSAAPLSFNRLGKTLLMAAYPGLMAV